MSICSSSNQEHACIGMSKLWIQLYDPQSSGSRTVLRNNSRANAEWETIKPKKWKQENGSISITGSKSSWVTATHIFQLHSLCTNPIKYTWVSLQFPFSSLNKILCGGYVSICQRLWLRLKQRLHTNWDPTYQWQSLSHHPNYHHLLSKYLKIITNISNIPIN